MAPTTSTKKTLPSKESALFKELLSLYETRQLKKGVKTADQILKKVPDHGETLSMKGLLYTHMGRRDEGLELVKKGIRLDLTSHICWHVYGLIQKGEKDYEGALKSYTQALKFDKESLNLLSDAANLQTQLRQFDALQETREQLLSVRPAMRRTWISLAVAYHLGGNLKNAKITLESYMNMVKDVPDYDFEHSELTLYYVHVLEEYGALSEALSVLDSNAKARVIVDRVAVMETRARLLSKLDSKSSAEEGWRSLIQRNPDCYDYYRELFKIKGFSLDDVTDETCEIVLQTLQELSEHHSAPLRIALNVSQGEAFRSRAHDYIQKAIRKGIPSLFSDVKSLYTDTSKCEMIGQIAEELCSQFKDSSSKAEGSQQASAVSPTSYLWILYFLAQHYSYLKDYQKALTVINTAIEHTPTLPELHSCKARLLKRAGDPLGAVRAIEQARKLDLQDRFLNTKSAKYHLRANLSEEAQALLGLFTKKDATSPGADLIDMQSTLYLIEEADCQKRLGKLGPALMKYIGIQKVFDDFIDDQYDFHFYSIRRSTINAYLKMMKWEDTLRYHPISIRSAVEAVRIYVSVHDNPKLATAGQVVLTDAEKKAQKKAKKAAAKEENKKQASSTNQLSNEDKGIEIPVAKDDDPDGSKALAAPDLIEQAWKVLKPFTLPEAPVRTDLACAIFDVSIRRHKYLQAAKALLAARALDEDSPELHIRIIELHKRVSDLPKPLEPSVAAALKSTFEALLPGDVTPATFNSQYLQRYGSAAGTKGALATLGAARALHVLGSPIDEIEGTVMSVLEPERELDVKTALACISFLQSLPPPPTCTKSSIADDFRARCDSDKTRFGLATCFKSAEALMQLRAEVLQAVAGSDLQYESASGSDTGAGSGTGNGNANANHVGGKEDSENALFSEQP